MRIRWLILISVASSVLMMLIAVAGLCLYSQSDDYAEIINMNWNIAFPENAGFSVLYGTDEGASFLGDGLRYHVFGFENPNPVEQMAEWTSEEGITAFGGRCYSQAIHGWMEALDVPEEWRPQFVDCRYAYMRQKDNSEIILVWKENEKRIFVAESFL